MATYREMESEIKRAFQVADGPEYGVDGLQIISVTGLEVAGRPASQIVEDLRQILPTGAKYLQCDLFPNRDAVALRFAHPRLKQVVGYQMIEEVALYGKGQSGAVKGIDSIPEMPKFQ
jgi:hypothetical protein